MPIASILSVGLGGMLGALCRYFIVLIPGLGNLLTIFISNVLGCFLFGFFLTRGLEKNLSLFLLTGFLGSLTTFSTFEALNYKLYSEGKIQGVFLYVLAHVLGGFLVFILGMKLGERSL
ncbi:MAG: CrcB family protein [Halobacteriovoraceae bacterium]|nr:CrcB family protein [Halobacteriovoraceae bacterium]